MRAVMAACALAAALVAGCGGGSASAPRDDPFTDIERTFHKPDPSQAAAPHWAPLQTLAGAGDRTVTVTVADAAIQWRVRWQCHRGTFAVTASPQPAGSDSAEGRCPGTGTVTFIGTGTRQLVVSAAGPWRMRIEQQVDTPVHEPALAGMTPRRVVAQGRFAPVERAGRGTARIYRLADGNLALRLEGFVTDPNSDLFVWLSAARRPRTTRDVLAQPHTVLAPLTATVGDQNYRLPKGTSLAQARSVVIWCEPVRIAYAAATLAKP